MNYVWLGPECFANVPRMNELAPRRVAAGLCCGLNWIGLIGVGVGQAMIEAGEVGEPVSAVLQSRDPDAPPFTYVKGGGGLFKDMGESLNPSVRG